MNDNIYIVIPAKNEYNRIGSVISKTLAAGFHNVVIVNDGSNDNTEQIARQFGVVVINHAVNLGPGAATQTGISYAIKKGAEIIVTIDADEQHLPKDIQGLVDTMQEKEVDVVIGSRFLKKDNQIPTTRIFYNKIANIISYILTGIYVTDSQSGMKAFSRAFAQKAVLNFNGFEFCIEIIRNIRIHKASYTEVPIHVLYTADTMKKGQNFITGVKMLGKLFKIF